MCEGEVPAMRAGASEFFLAAEHVACGMVFFDDDGARFEVVDEPVNMGGGRFFATVQQVADSSGGGRITAELYVGRRVR